MRQSIRVRGAREHNLQNVDVDIPRDSLTVVTGLSGSGKSSLAFDTIYAEGQRRYVESLSAYARQFLELMQKPDVDSIDGLSPAISIEQKTTSRNPRSTVGTVTEVYDYMRLLWARVGVPHSPATGLPIESQTVSQMVDRVMAMGEGARLYLLAPIVRGRKGEYRKELLDLRKRGFQRVKVDGELLDIDDVPALNKKRKHDIEAVVDRLVVRDGLKSRLADSFETALHLSDGLAFVENADSAERTTFSAKFACPVSGFTIDEIEPRLFSFNNPFGACPACDGLGTEMYFDPDLVIPDERLALAEGAIAPWANSSSQYYRQTLDGLSAHYGFKLGTPWRRLPKAVREVVLYGSGGDAVKLHYQDGNRSYEITKPFEGVIPNMERRWRETDSSWIRDEMAKFQTVTACGTCGGKRLKPQALAVKIAGRDISDVTGLSIDGAAAWFSDVESTFTAQQTEIARRILREINERLTFLSNVGLEYLTLSRASGTLSGGESQRIRLASQIGSGLTGVLYVLDEPSIGLHQRDNSRLLETLIRLRDLGNTVIMVEHDEEAIRSADYLIDMGPGAGIHGGDVVARGVPEAVMANPNSLTGQYLTGAREIPVPTRRRKAGKGRELTVVGARANNLADITVAFPSAPLPASPASLAVASRPWWWRPCTGPWPGACTGPGCIRGSTTGSTDWISSTKWSISTSRRSAARPAPTPPPTPAPSARYGTGSPPCRRPRPGAIGRDASRLTSRRALRGLPGRRADQDRDALPARRLRDLRNLQGAALQPGNPGGHLPRQEYRRRAGHDRRRGPAVLQGRPRHPQQARYPAAGGPGLHPPRPAGDHALGRRGPAGQAGQGTVPPGHGEDRLHPRRTHHRPSLR